MIEVLLADTGQLREKAFEIRREVFVQEQMVSAEDEFDEFESSSRHFVVLDDNHQPIGAARWRKTSKGIKLERFAVKEAHRGTGIGSALVKQVLKDVAQVEGTGQYVYLHAQLSAVPLYQKFGFEIIGDQFVECDILHYVMYKEC